MYEIYRNPIQERTEQFVYLRHHPLTHSIQGQQTTTQPFNTNITQLGGVVSDPADHGIADGVINVEGLTKFERSTFNRYFHSWGQ